MINDSPTARPDSDRAADASEYLSQTRPLPLMATEPASSEPVAARRSTGLMITLVCLGVALLVAIVAIILLSNFSTVDETVQGIPGAFTFA